MRSRPCGGQRRRNNVADSIFSIFPGNRRRRLYNWDKKLRSATNGSESISLKYDPDGNRIWKDSSETGKRKYIVDIVGELPVILMELNSSGGIVKTYIYANSEIIAQHDGDVKNHYTYNPFGELFAAETTENVSNPFKFTGQWFDDEIEEYYLRARQYNPHIGRFTSRDPVKGKFKEPITLHKYLYCGNDPINRIDPDGRFFGLASLLVSNSMESQLRKMDLKFHMKLFNKSKGQIDAFSIMNLQRGMTMDLMIANFEGGLKETVRDSGIEALGLLSENLSRLVGFMAETYDEREAILEILKGNKQLDDFVGEQIGKTFLEELGY